jgi:DNA polymerase III subunit delta
MLDLKRKIFKPVYFLSGEEPYYIDEISNFIEVHALDEAEKSFNQTIVYGKDADLKAILGLARQFPMMGERTVVIVKEAQNLKEFQKAGGSDDDDGPVDSGNVVNHLVAYLKDPQPTTILVFCYKYKTIDKRSAVAKALQKQSVFLETKKLYDNQVPEWIASYVKTSGYQIQPKAAYLLGEFIGNDLLAIIGELGKLFIKVPKGGEITTELIQDNTGISKDYNVFELQDALTARDVMRANRIISYFASNEKDNPLPMVLTILHGYFSKILVYHFIPDKSKFAAAQSLGVNPFFVERFAKAAAVYPTGKLKQIFSWLKECDLKSKGVDNSSISSGELLKEMVFKILH